MNSHSVSRKLLLSAAVVFGAVLFQTPNAFGEEVVTIKDVGGHHPHIHASIEELRAARKELKEAAHDFGGHREAALKAVDAAIEQLELARKFANKK